MKKKKKLKKQPISGGNPQIALDVFNNNLGTIGQPSMSPTADGGMGESLNEAKANRYKIVYIDKHYDRTSVGYINAYSEKQAAYMFRRQNDVYKIIDIQCVEDNSVKDGEQISLFEDVLNEASMSDIEQHITRLLPMCTVSRGTNKNSIFIETPLHRKYVIPLQIKTTKTSTDYSTKRFTGNGKVINGILIDSSTGTSYPCYYGIPRNHTHNDYEEDVEIYELRHNEITRPPMSFGEFVQNVNAGMY